MYVVTYLKLSEFKIDALSFPEKRAFKTLLASPRSCLIKSFNLGEFQMIFPFPNLIKSWETFFRRPNRVFQINPDKEYILRRTNIP